jgi:metal-dependent amidase/aminoacylase/carboxypeptidase family protein
MGFFICFFKALKSAVVTLGTFHCGCAPNVIADSASISGTVRAFEEPVLDIVHRRMRQICNGVEQSFDVQVDLNPSTDIDYPVTENTNDECIQNIRNAALKIVPEELVVSPASTMASEDFSFFLQKVPGCFFFLGSYPGNPDPLKDPAHEYLDRPHHKRDFDLDENCLEIGSSIWVQLIEDLLCS